ncbi:DNA excision repair protein ERCC-1 [Marchantia polymorpha subsp. ruderalis]
MGENGRAKKFVVQIPSAQEVELGSSGRGQSFNFFRPSSEGGASASTSGSASVAAPALTPPPLRVQAQASGPGTSFTEAFSFLRNTEFYSPPPAKPPPPPASAAAPSSTSSGGPPSSTTFSQQEASLAALSGQARNSILVSRRQQGNPILKHIRNVRWMFTDIVPDYILGQTSCALYLSLRYHLLHPDYIYFRIRELMKGFRLRVVLCHVDVDDVIKPLHEVTKTCLLHDCSLLCAWSQEECARYLETIKSYENKPADYIQERTDNDYLSRLTSALTTVRHVNKTDAVSLGTAFGTLAGIFNGSMEDFARCPGIGERKVKRLYDAFYEPFRRVPTTVKVEAADGQEVTPTQVPEVQKHTAEASGKSGQKPGEGNVSIGQEVLPTSKLISRDGDVSVRDALNAVRGKLKGKPSPNKDGSSNRKKDETSPTKKEKMSPNKRRRSINTIAPGTEVVDLADSSSEPIDKSVQATGVCALPASKVADSAALKEQHSCEIITDPNAESLGEDYVISLDDD